MPKLHIRDLIWAGLFAAATGVAWPALAGTSPSEILWTNHDGMNFSQTRAALSDRFHAAEADEQVDVALENAKFLIGWMMLPEAENFIGYAREHADPQDQDAAARIDVYSAMVSLLSGEALEAEPGHIDLLRQDPLWFALMAIHGGERPDAGRLTEAIKALPHHSKQVIGRVAPELFEVALEARNENLAQSLIDISAQYGGLENTSQIMLMRGYLEQLRDHREAAFDFFAWAADGRDVHAARAHLELADIALENPTPASLIAVRDVLLEDVTSWRGDEAALKIRARLAQVSEEIGDIETAIVTMSDIEKNYPDTPEAELASERIGVILRHFANIITEESLTLSESARMLRHLEPYMGLHPERILVHAAYAERLRENGLTEASRAEYAIIWSGLLPDELEKIPVELADRIVLERAANLLSKGHALSAMSTIDRRPETRDPGLDVEYAKVEIESIGKLSKPTDDPEINLILARHALEAGEDQIALEGFAKASGLTDVDRINAIRLAAEAGRKDISDLITGLPDDQQTWVGDLAKLRAQEPPSLSPLSGSVADDILNQASQVIASN